jgi:hypothetical protein
MTVNMFKLAAGEINVTAPATMPDAEAEDLGEMIDEEMRNGLQAVVDRLKEKFPQLTFEMEVNGW